MLVTSIFSFSQNVLHPTQNIFQFWSHTSIHCLLQLLSIWSSLKFCRLVKAELFTKRHIFRLVEIQTICRRQNKCYLTTEFLSGIGTKHCGKRRKCCLPAFSPFPTMFSKGFIFKILKSQDCVVKNQATL